MIGVSFFFTFVKPRLRYALLILMRVSIDLCTLSATPVHQTREYPWAAHVLTFGVVNILDLKSRCHVVTVTGKTMTTENQSLKSTKVGPIYVAFQLSVHVQYPAPTGFHSWVQSENS